MEGVEIGRRGAAATAASRVAGRVWPGATTGPGAPGAVPPSEGSGRFGWPGAGALQRLLLLRPLRGELRLALGLRRRVEIRPGDEHDHREDDRQDEVS